MWKIQNGWCAFHWWPVKTYMTKFLNILMQQVKHSGTCWCCRISYISQLRDVLHRLLWMRPSGDQSIFLGMHTFEWCNQYKMLKSTCICHAVVPKALASNGTKVITRLYTIEKSRLQYLHHVKGEKITCGCKSNEHRQWKATFTWQNKKAAACGMWCNVLAQNCTQPFM